MKRLILAGASLGLVMGCHDGTSPLPPAAPAADIAGAFALKPNRPIKHGFFAVVDINGILIHGSHVSSVIHLGPGRYEVTFTSNVSQCAYVATTNNAYSQAIQVFTAGGHLGANGVYVETKNQGGGLTDGPFNLVVTCGGTGIRYAVIGYGANLVRATAGTTLSFLGSGRYNITFPTSVSACAYIATVGDPGNALVFNPSGVYTGSGPDARTVYIETKNGGGGLQDAVPFHLAVVCPNGKTRFAVVKAAGTIERASKGTTSTRPATGQYTIKYHRNIRACATVATRGSVGTAVPFTPATVEIVPGPRASAIGIQVRQLLFFGGAFIDQDFHAATVCDSQHEQQDVEHEQQDVEVEGEVE